MSEYFRYSLSIDKKPLVKVCEEMTAVWSYLSIQKSRYAERISVTENIEKDALEYYIPVFSIQTLIENAIKYGLKTHPDTVVVKIDISLQENLVIKISNSGKLYHCSAENNSEGTNTGLENLISRLHFLDKESKFILEEKDQHVVATIIIKPMKNVENPENYNC
jgi:LytS/YehU family sensor histidine kinase